MPSSSSSSSFWKKAKLGRVSRLVSDLRSKCGGRSSSLPLATGFPTSLADLFVKHRARLKKASRKHSRGESPPTQAASAADHRSVINSSSLLSSSSLPPLDSSISVSQCELLGDSVELAEVEEAGVQSDAQSQRGLVSEIPIQGFSQKGRISVGSIAYLVLVLAFASRKLALGVTLLVIAFFLLGRAKKWLLWLLEPCENAKRRSLSSTGANLLAAREGQRGSDDKILISKTLNRKCRVVIDEDDGLEVQEDCSRRGLVPASVTVGADREQDECANRRGECAVLMKMKVGNLVVLLIVLCGLVGGRLLALVLTLACYLLVKLAEMFLKRFKS